MPSQLRVAAHTCEFRKVLQRGPKIAACLVERGGFEPPSPFRLWAAENSASSAHYFAKLLRNLSQRIYSPSVRHFQSYPGPLNRADVASRGNAVEIGQRFGQPVDLVDDHAPISSWPMSSSSRCSAGDLIVRPDAAIVVAAWISFQPSRCWLAMNASQASRWACSELKSSTDFARK